MPQKTAPQAALTERFGLSLFIHLIEVLDHVDEFHNQPAVVRKAAVDFITVLDFKTDYVTQETIDSRTEYYRPQVTAYADALSRIYNLPVKESLLYYFTMDEFRKL